MRNFRISDSHITWPVREDEKMTGVNRYVTGAGDNQMSEGCVDLPPQR